eukprot:Gregarina_sp_Poly_1__6928@NODE_3762_length_892_cov_6495_072727_g2414_i0_p1_GENE_NODE_3762_length_892_cov_6495_072727_g2414_i0NODE_3762_length_892_cov_6495_072727_g2414_i0_p1_ORF_typecomplete_len266_score35_65DUF5105/PF17118_5/0_028_NODE_3762_length_892_cov_6495_072727_g2414_i087800
MGKEQSCLGRCHIYHTGEYGACNSYQVTAKDETGPCGDTPQNACISTFNGGWDSSMTNCGNCYYVEMAYEDGTVRSTYLKTIDINGSETKFEMRDRVLYKMRQSHSSAYLAMAPETITTAAAEATTVGAEATTVPTETTTVEAATTTVEAEITTVETTTVETTMEAVEETMATEGESGGSAISTCKSLVGNAGNASWDTECKSLCAYYADQPIHCPAHASGTGLAACVKKLHTYCNQ